MLATFKYLVAVDWKRRKLMIVTPDKLQCVRTCYDT